MFVLDSLGMLSTEKEIRDTLDDKQVRDMTKSQLVNPMLRYITRYKSNYGFSQRNSQRDW